MSDGTLPPVEPARLRVRPVERPNDPGGVRLISLELTWRGFRVVGLVNRAYADQDIVHVLGAVERDLAKTIFQEVLAP